MSKKFFGKYRGTVINNVDPMQMGRIQVSVAEFSSLGLAMPCVPRNDSKKVGSALPEIGAGVWIEFEQGDLNSPIWTGFFYDRGARIPPSLRNRK
jgi:hypothetical protein